MGTKYHINSKGVPAICRAQVKCPFGSEESHYSSKEEAQKAADSLHVEEYGLISGFKSMFKKVMGGGKYKIDKKSSSEPILKQLESQGLTINDENALKEIQTLEEKSKRLETEVIVGEISIKDMEREREKINNELSEIISNVDKSNITHSEPVEVKKPTYDEKLSEVKEKYKLELDDRWDVSTAVNKMYSRDFPGSNYIYIKVTHPESVKILKEQDVSLENLRKMRGDREISKDNYEKGIKKIHQKVNHAIALHETSDTMEKQSERIKLHNKLGGIIINDLKSETESKLNWDDPREQREVEEIINNNSFRLHANDYELNRKGILSGRSSKIKDQVARSVSANANLVELRRSEKITEEEFELARNNLKTAIARAIVIENNESREKIASRWQR